MSKNARYDLAVANLRVAPVSSTGGNLCFADPHSDPASLLTAAGASMLHHSTAQSSGGPPLQHGPGPSCVRGYLELGYLDHNHTRHLARVPSFRVPAEAFFCCLSNI